jgi:hypothetical protein
MIIFFLHFRYYILNFIIRMIFQVEQSTILEIGNRLTDWFYDTTKHEIQMHSLD